MDRLQRPHSCLNTLSGTTHSGFFFLFTQCKYKSFYPRLRFRPPLSIQLVQVHCRSLWGPGLFCHEEAGLWGQKMCIDSQPRFLCSRFTTCSPVQGRGDAAPPAGTVEFLKNAMSQKRPCYHLLWPFVFMLICSRQLLPPAQVHASRCQVDFLFPKFDGWFLVSPILSIYFSFQTYKCPVPSCHALKHRQNMRQQGFI